MLTGRPAVERGPIRSPAGDVDLGQGTGECGTPGDVVDIGRRPSRLVGEVVAEVEHLVGRGGTAFCAHGGDGTRGRHLVAVDPGTSRGRVVPVTAARLLDVGRRPDRQ